MTDDNVPTDPGCQPRAIVESFLQNVVVLDDFVVISQQGDERPGETPDTTIVSPDYRVPLAASDSGVSPGRRDVELHADTVIDAFADLGMVCAVLKAARGSAFPERTVRAAVRADIVVLDWKIHESDGNVALDVMKRILADDQNSHRLRLIAIYTGEPDLGDISRRIQEVIQDFYEGEDLVVDCPSRITKGPVRVVILGKTGTVGAHSPSPRHQEVAEHELAEKLADEFGAMTTGLLRTVALAGIATIRENAHRVLARFDQTLDAGYLGHRILLPHPPDAEDHLVAALGSELLSVLENDRPGTHAGIEAIERWLNRAGGPDISEPFSFPGHASAVDGWIGLLQQGISAKDVQRPDCKVKVLEARAAEPFSDDPDAAIRSDHHFAALLNLKTRHPGQRRRLTIGTVLYADDDDGGQYLLCLQPKCDSIRLDDPSGFPFMPLQIVQDDNTKMSFLLVVERQEGEWEKLGITPKPSELIVRSFEPGSNPAREVLAVEDEQGDFYFKDVGQKRYRWIAEMKDDHAFRVAGAVASALARPGPNDAEWLRRASR